MTNPLIGQVETLQTQLIEFVLSGEQDAANNLLEQWANQNGYRKAISYILEPVLEDIGRRWDKEQISLAAGYLAGKVAEHILQLALVHEQAVPLSKGPVIIGNIEDDFHSLGRKLLRIFLNTAGWNVVDIGNDVTPAAFVDAAVLHKAKVIGVSAMMFTTAQNIRKVRDEIDKRKLTDTIKLAVGGAVFKIRPDLVREVGGNGTAANAVEAPALFEKLWKEVSAS